MENLAWLVMKFCRELALPFDYGHLANHELSILLLSSVDVIEKRTTLVKGINNRHVIFLYFKMIFKLC